jgi:ribosome-associated protein
LKLDKPLKTKDKALKIAEFTLGKKAQDITILDIKNLSGICDYFIICSGDSGRQVRAIYEGVAKECKKNKIIIKSYESDEAESWILVDFFDIILHIFSQSTREFYDLEYLWSKAKKIKFPSSKLT